MKNISSKSDWNAEQIKAFLEDHQIPIRISVMDGDYPLVCSVWFEYDAGNLICVSHKDSKLALLLQEVGRCGFEIAPNDPPYRGVRGKADVTFHQNGVEKRLRSLIARYLGDTNKGLANWLLGRVAQEVEIVLNPIWITAWDYGGRMDKAQD